jgi:hypothetical protein
MNGLMPNSLLNQSAAPRRGEVLTIGLVAILLRVIIFAVEVHGGISVADYTKKGDTPSYMANAQVMCGERSLASLSEYETRVFPGYPAMIAVTHRLGVPLRMSALLVTWICAGIAAAAAAMVFDDARVGWAMTCLVPHYLLISSLGMSEAPMLAVVLVALLASQRNRPVVAGVLFGFAGVIRPMACFALVGLMYARAREGKWKSGLFVLCITGVVFGLEILAMQWWTGNAMRGVHVYAQHPDAYAGHMFEWPFQSLLTTPKKDGTPIGKVIYIWVHVAITLFACGWITEKALHGGRSKPRDAVAFPWLAGNSIFVFCIGGVWGFRHFARFTIPAAPAMFWTLRRWLPRKMRWWVLIAGVSMFLTVFGVFDSP